MRFIVAYYGMRHAGMLLTHLASIERSHPGAQATVYWQDADPDFIRALQKTFAWAEFRSTDFAFDADPLLRISSKVLCWTRAAEEHADEPQICFADADTLILRDITHFFGEADVVVTHHPEPAQNPDRAALNTGVLLARGGEAASAFFRRWRDRTLEILRTPELYAKANDHALAYAASDQMAVHDLLGYRSEQLCYTIEAEGRVVNVALAPSPQLNESNSRPLDDAICIIHYKGGWQSVLLEGRGFTKRRPRQRSWEMLVLYLRSFREALQRLNAAAATRFTARDLGIVEPLYVAKDGRFLPALYPVSIVAAMARRRFRSGGRRAVAATSGTRAS